MRCWAVLLSTHFMSCASSRSKSIRRMGSSRTNTLYRLPVCQVIDYGERVLLIQPWRNSIMVALTDCHVLQCIRVVRAAQTFQYHLSDPVSLTQKAGVQQLRALLNAPFEAHGYDTPTPPSFDDPPLKLSIDGFLGMGASAKVYRVIEQLSNTPYALKIFTRAKDCASEAKILEQLGTIDGVVRLAAARDRFLLLRDVGTAVRELTAQQYHDLVRCMRDVHKKGICHRDLRVENVIVSSDRCLKVIDWHSAKRSGDKVNGGGALFYASDAYLQARANGADYTASPKDDLISIVRMAYVQVRRLHVALYAIDRRSHEAIRKWWEAQAAIPHVYRTVLVQLYASAAAADYDNLCRLLSELLRLRLSYCYCYSRNRSR